MLTQSQQFNSENILLSVLAHLVLLAILVTGATIIIKRNMLVTPDRIDIVEIDLSQVKITADETKLQNSDTPQTTKSEYKESAPVPERVATQSDTPEKIQEPTLVDSEVKKQEPEKIKKTDKIKQETPAPKKKTVIRVNREVMSLDCTMTVSVVDALRVAMTRCWVIDTKRPDINDIRAVAHLTLRPNGTVRDVWFESAARADDDPGFAYVLDTIRSAIDTCQPFKMLPRSEFSKWEKIQLTFYPTQGKVM